MIKIRIKKKRKSLLTDDRGQSSKDQGRSHSNLKSVSNNYCIQLAMNFLNLNSGVGDSGNTIFVCQYKIEYTTNPMSVKFKIN